MLAINMELFNGFLEKVSTSRDFRERVKDGRDLVELLPLSSLLPRLLPSIAELLPTLTGQCQQLVNALRLLLHPGNVPTLRQEGLRLLLLWLREDSNVIPECLQLYGTCIDLRTLDPTIPQSPFPLSAEGEPPLLPSGSTPAEASLHLFNHLLHLLTNDPLADRRSTGWQWNLLVKHYLTLLYPEVCRREGLLPNNTADETFLEGNAPPAVQALLLRYLAIWLVRSPEMLTGKLAQLIAPSANIPIAALMLEEEVMGSVASIELVHEVLRQALLLPVEYAPFVRVAMGIMRAWLFQPRDRRPAFLRASDELNTRQTAGYLQRYISMLAGCLSSRSMGDEQQEVQREALFFLRGLAMEAFLTLRPEVWDCLINSLLDLVASVLTEYSGKRNCFYLRFVGYPFGGDYVGRLDPQSGT